MAYSSLMPMRAKKITVAVSADDMQAGQKIPNAIR